MEKPLFIGIGWGFATAVGLALLVGGFLWYQSRPKSPKPPKAWDTAAIKADYDSTNTEGDKNTVVFYYTLENTTDFDYRIEDAQSVLMSATLMKQKNFSPFGENERIDYPIFVPAKKRVRFRIHLGYPCPVKEKENADLEERRKHRKAVEKYVADELTNLDGFDFLDEANRYEIVFPAGWKRAKQ